ncbi:alpha-hydroxy-acid oxidizing protein [Bradyrhizobium sp. JYMT SZCCT0428]|uniref:oxidoreductase n=1 Tax=Bradyrhizobium sp. JYMT SZCCT0428 TaxID=2807673 RepID=UPI0024C06B4D|nr:alpha-hydroxy-acid oxidizing protein [Bradyrhizobium sp. JYMT SZCCT0428]
MVVWSPFRFNSGQEMANRFAIAPLTTDSSHEEGTATEHELEFVRRRAASGFGATISSATYVEQNGRSWQGTGATHDGHLPGLRRLAEAMHAAGGLAILQIYDGGRIAKPELIGEQCLRAPSAVASLRPGAKTPRAMTSDEVASLIASFREAASLARKAGFDGVEIHGANHYAIHQFFSPRANHRVDHWGGTLSKRMNFALAVAQAVRDALGPKLIAGFRVTPFEAEPDGYTLEDAKLLCNELARLDLDYISISLDDYRKSRPQRETRVYNGPVEENDAPAENPITEFARVIAGRSAVMASGGIKTCRDAEEAIAMGADLVAVGRAVVVDPEWLSKVRSRNEASIIAGLPKDEREIAAALSIPPRMVEYLLSRPGWIPRL